MNNRIRFFDTVGFRIALIAVMIAACGIVAAGLLIIGNERRHAREEAALTLKEREQELARKAGSSARLLAAVSLGVLLTYDYATLDEYGEAMRRDPDIAFVNFYDERGRLISKKRPAPSGDSVITAKTTLTAGKNRVGTVEVGVAKTRLHAEAAAIKRRAESSARSGWRLLAAAIGILLLTMTAAIVAAVNRIVARPLRDLVRHMAAAPAPRQGEDDSPPIGHQARRHDEIGSLIATYQDMTAQLLGYQRELNDRLSDLEGKKAELDLLNASLERRVAARTGELEEANAELKNFANIISHDMRAPLVSIKGFSDELARALRDIETTVKGCANHLAQEDRDRIERLLRQDTKESLQFIVRSVGRMDAMIAALLRLSRIGRQELRAEPVDTAAAVRAVLDSLRHQIERNRAEITLRDLPVLFADRTAIDQLFGNLLDNALKFLQPGRPGRVEISAEKKPGETVFRIRDNGRGIAPHEVAGVFDLFRRAGKQDVQGDGMGLAYVKALVRRMGGSITCDSELDAGTTFTLLIPDKQQGGEGA